MIRFFICLVILFFSAAEAGITAETALEPFTYSENFESRMLSAWASYPLWQDTAYDPNFRVNEIIPGDTNISIVQKVTPYTTVDNYAGAEKLFDIYLVPGSSITLRYYMKSHLPCEFFKVRLAAGKDGKIDYTVAEPRLNRWERLTVTYSDFISQNPCLAGRDRIKVNAVAFLAKVPKADPAMPLYLGLDDITVKGAQAMQFQFAEPQVYKLSEWKPFISRNHYHKGGRFAVKGRLPLNADRVELVLASFTDTTKTVLKTALANRAGVWTYESSVTFPDGLYLGILRAYNKTGLLSETQFTVHVAPAGIGGKHPRLWFDGARKAPLESRLKSDRFSKVYEDISNNAKAQREQLPVESLVFDLDQFPDEDWLPTWSAWGSHIYPTGDAVYWNSLAYQFHGDREAGEYAKNVLVAIAKWPNWTHPWQVKRGRFSEHRTGAWSHRLALAYDLTYDLMTEDERRLIRKALMDNIVIAAHRTYVLDNNVTCNTSNWVAHIAGGSLMVQVAIFGDGPDVDELEPYFTGAAFKAYDMIQKTVDTDGAWGEGLGYNGYSFHTLSQSLPSLENVFSIDMSKTLDGSYREYIWGGLVNKNIQFYFGDSGGNLGPIPNWAWLLAKYRDPLLGWFYNFLKKNEEFMDVLYETKDVPQNDPFDENPVRLFRNVGSTVFKGGWGEDDFTFVLRTGPFYNHQHLDQGTFWLADHGEIFIEERHGSTYYDDPLYQSWYTQPVGHSTILIDGNHQSQRVGDHGTFAEGFEDYAHVTHFLDGARASFVSGDIGRLYWGKVKCLARNVLFLKPRTLLMLDTAAPSIDDADVTLLYQTLRLKDIHADTVMSTITKNGASLYIRHLHPEHRIVEAVETPHYLHTSGGQKPLEREGMLTVTARTSGTPLVIANLLTASKDGKPDIKSETGEGFISGVVNGTPFAFSTNPGKTYTVKTITTDALALTGDAGTLFAAMCTKLFRDGTLLLESEQQLTCELSQNRMKYYLSSGGKAKLGVAAKPSRVTVNGKVVTDFSYDAEKKAVSLTLPAGEGVVGW